MSSLALRVAEHQHSSWHARGTIQRSVFASSCVELHWGLRVHWHCRSDCQCAACGPAAVAGRFGGSDSESLRPAALPSVIAGSESSSRFLFSPQPSGLPVKLGGSLPVPLSALGCSESPASTSIESTTFERPWPLAPLHRSSRPLTISGTVTNVLFCSCRPLNSLSVCSSRGPGYL